jgi:nicotinamide mononucleotide transporter
MTVLGYKLSYLELIGTVSGMLCVYLTAREKLICWLVGIINSIFFFIMFYEVQLYSDMLLQIFFLASTVYGWWKWLHPKDASEANSKSELKITILSVRMRIILITLTVIGISALGTLMSQIHVIIPSLFQKKASYPYPDAFTTVVSISAQIIMTRKKKECWILWIIVDIISAVLYFVKGINLAAIEYIIFGLIAFSGYVSWTREYSSYVMIKENPAGEAI